MLNDRLEAAKELTREVLRGRGRFTKGPMGASRLTLSDGRELLLYFSAADAGGGTGRPRFTVGTECIGQEMQNLRDRIKNAIILHFHFDDRGGPPYFLWLAVKDIPLHRMAWDEPGVTSRITVFMPREALAAAFQPVRPEPRKGAPQMAIFDEPVPRGLAEVLTTQARRPGA